MSGGVFVWGWWQGEDVVEAKRVCESAAASPVAGGFGFGGTLDGGNLRVFGSRTGYVAGDAQVAGVVAAACGFEHALYATDSDDRPQLFGWGWNAHAQAAPGNALAEVSAPSLAFRAPHAVRKLACGEQHSLALLHDGALLSWGAASCGELGHGERSDGAAPRRVSLPASASDVAAGARHSVAVVGGAFYAWGWGLYGQLGSGGNEDVLAAEPVAALRGVAASSVAAGLQHSLFVTEGGDAYAAGANADGQLGLDSAEEVALSPQLVEALESVQRASCGARHSVFLTADGSLHATGWNAHGQLCTGDRVSWRVPTRVLGSVTDAQCGWWHTLVRM